ncbi:MAG TPA: hypothetical protein VFP61_07075 [Acidimicrobiales bacterium]|nr:hypothetical protein [Acidimicrobiales bacterium]
MRVLPDAGALDKQFDYLLAASTPGRPAGVVQVGSEVRVDLHGRRVGGWVVGVGVTPPPGVDLRPVARVRGHGPTADLVELSAWAAWRWAGRRAALLATASPPRAVAALPPPRLTPPAPPRSTPVHLPAAVADGRPLLVRLAPAVDPTPLLAAIAQRGPTLVVVPSSGRAAALAGRLRRGGGDVALVPDGWAQARAGAAVVVGARAAAWAPCPGLAAVVVVDAHDEALVQEQAPTWSAFEVAAERARRAGVVCVAISAWPTAALAAACGEVVAAPVTAERAGWAPVEVVDMRDVDPRLGLWSPRVVDLARGGGRVVVVVNRTGRARLLVCAACRSVARCERCDAAVEAAAVEAEAVEAAAGAPRGAGAAVGEVLRCPRCALERPVVCGQCGSVVLRRLRVGVSRAREQLETLAGRPVGEVTAATTTVPATPVLIGTEAVLHRAADADVVVFADLDAQLLAPRYRAAEETGAMLARAARLVGGRRRPGARLVVQTRSPGHPVVAAAAAGAPGDLAAAELAVRRELRLPPAAGLAVCTGPAAAAFAAAVAEGARGAGAGAGDGDAGLEVLDAGDRIVVRAATTAALCDALAATPRPPGRLRIEVDPLTL